MVNLFLPLVYCTSVSEKSSFDNGFYELPPPNKPGPTFTDSLSCSLFLQCSVCSCIISWDLWYVATHLFSLEKWSKPFGLCGEMMKTLILCGEVIKTFNLEKWSKQFVWRSYQNAQSVQRSDKNAQFVRRSDQNAQSVWRSDQNT